jgi:hypothetical protein
MIAGRALRDSAEVVKSSITMAGGRTSILLEGLR